MECGNSLDSLNHKTRSEQPNDHMCVMTHKYMDAAAVEKENSSPGLWSMIQPGELESASTPESSNSIQGQHKTSSSPVKIDIQVLERLRSLLCQEPADHLNLNSLRNIDRSTDNKVDNFLRDEAVSNLRTLHRFYDRPPEELLHTVSILDRFISRVKVKPKYIACVATACFLITMKIHSERSNLSLLARPTTPSAATLADIIRFGGTGADLDRMQEIIVSKSISLALPVVMDFVRLINGQLELPTLYTLEAAIFSVSFYCQRPSVLALALCRIHKSVSEYMLGCFMQLCMISQSELTICESFLRKSEQRFRETRWRSPASGMWPGLAADRRRNWRSPLKGGAARKSACVPLYACPDLTVREEEQGPRTEERGALDGPDTGDASSFLLALSLDRSFPGVELTYHQQCPVVRILWRSQLQNWHPKNGEHPFVFVLWSQMKGKRLVSAEETRSMFQRALLMDTNVRERIDFPSNRPEEHRVFEFCPKTYSKPIWEARVCKAAMALGFEPPSSLSLHALLAEVKAYQNNQREIHNRNHSIACDVPFLKRFGSKSVSSCRKLYERKSKHSKHFSTKQDSHKRQRRKMENESILVTLFGISPGKSDSRGFSMRTTGLLHSGAKDLMSNACGLADVNESYHRYPVASVVEV